MKDLINQKAKIILKDNVLVVKTETKEFRFIANKENYVVIQNQGILGGDIVYENGKVIVCGDTPTQFKSGETYIIQEFEFYEDMLGKTTIKFEKNYSSIFIEFKTFDNQFCDL